MLSITWGEVWRIPANIAAYPEHTYPSQPLRQRKGHYPFPLWGKVRMGASRSYDEAVGHLKLRRQAAHEQELLQVQVNASDMRRK